MRKLAVVLFFSLCALSSIYGQKYRLGQRPTNQNPADYPIKVHISATHFRACAFVGINGACDGGFYADSTLDGKKLELSGAIGKDEFKLIVPGNYSARLAKQKPRDGGRAVLFQEYFLLLPDKTAWPCEITGLSE